MVHAESGFSLILLTDLLQKMSHFKLAAVVVPDNLYALSEALEYTRLQFFTNAVDKGLPFTAYSNTESFSNAKMTDNFILNTSGNWIFFASILVLRALFGLLTGGKVETDFIRIYKKAYLTVPMYAWMFCYLNFAIFSFLQMNNVNFSK
jgi:hypothetical protein